MSARSAASAVVNAQRRFRNRRRQDRMRTWRRVGVVLAGLGALVGGGWVTMNSSLFDVRTVTVEGTSRLTTGQVLSAAGVGGGSSLFRLDTRAVARRVLQLKPVADVAVSRDWPHGVVIDVTERHPVAVVSGPGTSMLLDAEGVAFAPATAARADLVAVHVDAPVPGTGERAAKAAMEVLEALPAAVRHRVTSMQAPTPTEVSFSLHNGRTVVWGTADDSATKAAVLRSLLHRPAQVYDVSTPDVVVTR